MAAHETKSPLEGESEPKLLTVDYVTKSETCRNKECLKFNNNTSHLYGEDICMTRILKRNPSKLGKKCHTFGCNSIPHTYGESGCTIFRIDAEILAKRSLPEVEGDDVEGDAVEDISEIRILREEVTSLRDEIRILSHAMNHTHNTAKRIILLETALIESNEQVKILTGYLTQFMAELKASKSSIVSTIPAGTSTGIVPPTRTSVLPNPTVGTIPVEGAAPAKVVPT
jgi:hypothetical protein